MNFGPPAQALLRYEMLHSFRMANVETAGGQKFLSSPLSFFPMPDLFYSTGECNGVPQELYQENKGRIDAVYMDLAAAFNGQIGYPLRKENAQFYANQLGRIWGGNVSLVDGVEQVASSGTSATLLVGLKAHKRPDYDYRVIGYSVLSAE